MYGDKVMVVSCHCTAGQLAWVMTNKAVVVAPPAILRICCKGFAIIVFKSNRFSIAVQLGQTVMQVGQGTWPSSGPCQPFLAMLPVVRLLPTALRASWISQNRL